MSVTCTADNDTAPPEFPLKVAFVMVTPHVLLLAFADLLALLLLVVLLLPVHATATGLQLLLNNVSVMLSMPLNALDASIQDAP